MPGRRYRTLSSYFRENFGQPVRKISLDAGFSCPNRDGRTSDAGCIFCEPRSFSPAAGEAPLPVDQQLREGIHAGQSRGVRLFFAYFQAYTNTDAPVARLKSIYDVVRAFPEIIGLSIGTRPDCLDQKKLELISSYAGEYEVWLEVGMQSVHDRTLQRINRGHDAAAFFQAVRLIRQYPGIKVCAHVILGLPGENPEMEKETACAVARLQVEGIKLHPLHVVQGTALAREYAARSYLPLAREEYVERAVRFLERLWPRTVIHRLCADSLADWLLAPAWVREKNSVLQAIQAKMEQEDTWQGKAYQA
ncbi:TIGR01212 family radical SAM protein [candidate division FCPU426 bacterium]|nr:TIGR01212 family radical SAM protein [candidate division FCPU426 bacterium]